MSNQIYQDDYTLYYAQSGCTILNADSNTAIAAGATNTPTFVVGADEGSWVTVVGSIITFKSNGVYAINTYTRLQPFSLQTSGIAYELTLVSASTTDTTYNGLTLAYKADVPAAISATNVPSQTYFEVPMSTTMYFHKGDSISLYLKNNSPNQILTVLSTGTSMLICKIK